MIDTTMLREQIADTFNIQPTKVCCYHCAKWGYNCGRVLDANSESKCTHSRKSGKTYAGQWCKHFSLKK